MDSNNIGWRQSARLRCVNLPMLYYSRRHTYTIRLLLVLAVWAAMSNQQYQEEAQYEREVAAKRAEQLGKCTQGNLVLTEEADTGKGYGKRATVCRKALEFDV